MLGATMKYMYRPLGLFHVLCVLLQMGQDGHTPWENSHEQNY